MKAKKQGEQTMRPIPGIPGYMVTADGDIVGTHPAGRIRKAYPNIRDGRLRVCLSVCNKRSMHSVHVLVYKAYNNVSVIPAGYDVHHVNAVYTDNRPCNLALKQSNAHIKDHLRAKLAAGMRMNRKLSDKDVHAICGMLSNGVPAKDIYAKFTILSYSMLSRIRLGKTWQHISNKYF